MGRHVQYDKEWQRILYATLQYNVMLNGVKHLDETQRISCRLTVSECNSIQHDNEIQRIHYDTPRYNVILNKVKHLNDMQ
jgi:hypothetical protein